MEKCELLHVKNKYNNPKIKNSAPNCVQKNIKYAAHKDFEGLHNDITDGATHYFNPDKVSTPAWAKELQKTKIIGKHHFYK